VIRARAKECNAPLEFVTDAIEELPIALVGSHQKQNAALALAALRAANIRVDDSAVTHGLASVRWPARFQRWDDRTIIDGAHNPAGARVLAESWRNSFRDERATIVLAALQDKHAAGMTDALIAIASRFVLPHARTERAIPPDELAALIREAAPSLAVRITDSFDAALSEAQTTAERVLITGSLHFAGEALAALAGNPDDLEDCLQ
jgi:dihydrofolate synthase/folylpolyglutamate synthase